MPVKSNSRTATVEPETQPENQEQEQPKAKDPIKVSINQPSPKVSEMGESMHWSQARDISLRGVSGNIFDNFRPDARMLDAAFTVVGYIIPHSRTETKQHQVIFDADYVIAWLRWGFEDLEPTDVQLDEIVERYKDWDTKERELLADAKIREAATLLHETKGSASKGFDFYYNMLKNAE